MPKIVDYPRASLKAALELAKAVDDLGGECSSEMAAERLNRKISGAFKALVSAAIKFGVLTNKSQKLTTSPLYKAYKLAYTPEESRGQLRTMLLSPALFRAVYARFAGKQIPVSHFEKLLIREFEVPDDMGSRIAAYFIEGAKQCGLLQNNQLIDVDSVGATEPGDVQPENSQEVDTGGLTSAPASELEIDTSSNRKIYVVRVTGPGINSTIEVHESEDMLIVQAMLKKVEKALQDSDIDLTK